MPELTDRGRRFRAAIVSFIEARREAEAKRKGKEDDAELARKYGYTTWLAAAAARAHNLRAVTHAIKFTHSAIKGATSIHFGPDTWVSRPEIGTHNLIQGFEEDFAISDARHLDVHALLMNVLVDQKRLLDWVRLADPDLTSALHEDPEVGEAMMASLLRVTQPESTITTSALAKQVYWLQGSGPLDDAQYHILQPMFSSSLENEVHRQIRDARNAAFEARGTKKQKPTHADHHTYPNLVARTFGGSNAQNVSPMNKARGGINYLLPSLPPPAWKLSGINLLKQESAFDGLIRFGGMRELVRTLIDFLKSNPDPKMATRKHREMVEQAIGQELAMFSVAVRTSHPAGWTRDHECRLPDCERLWLDPDRIHLLAHENPQHPEWTTADLRFEQDYNWANWPDEIAERFGNWLNARLRDAGLVTVALPERNHWARQAILDVAWPVPMQRRAARNAS